VNAICPTRAQPDLQNLPHTIPMVNSGHRSLHRVELLAVTGHRLETIACCLVRKPFRLLREDEEPLCRSMRAEMEVYRFTWRSSFDGDAVVRIGRWGDEITLRWACRRMRPPGADEAPPVVALTLADWARLQEALIAASFWALDPDEGPILRGLDGAFWAIEGRRKDIYRAVSVWSPDRAAIYDLGSLFFELPGPPLAEVDIC